MDATHGGNEERVSPEGSSKCLSHLLASTPLHEMTSDIKYGSRKLGTRFFHPALLLWQPISPSRDGRGEEGRSEQEGELGRGRTHIPSRVQL